MLEIYTSTIWTKDPDKLDITVKSAKEGRIFAPTWQIVTLHKNGLITDEEYTEAYLLLMRSSYKKRKGLWETFLNKERIVFCCYCPHEKMGVNIFCHRYILADIFVKLGAVYKGEIK